MHNVKFSFEKNKKKKRRMRILGARIFSKFFGGKIENFQTDVDNMEKLKKTAHAYFTRLYNIKQLLTTTNESQNQNIQVAQTFINFEQALVNQI